MGIIEFVIVVLFAIFTYKKINNQGDIAAWSWWRVTSPLWIYVIFAFVVYILFFGLFFGLITTGIIIDNM